MTFYVKLKDCPPNSVCTSEPIVPDADGWGAAIWNAIRPLLPEIPEDAWMVTVDLTMSVERFAPVAEHIVENET